MSGRTLILSAALAAAVSASVQAENTYGLKPGKVDLKSASVLAFGPAGTLFIGDAQGAMIYAVESGDAKGAQSAAGIQIENLNQKIAETLHAQPGAVKVADLTVNPETGHVYLAVNVEGQGPKILKVEEGGALSELKLDQIAFAKAALPNAAEDKVVGEGRRQRNNRTSSITDMAFEHGQLLVSGLSSDANASNVWAILFPFVASDGGAALEIYHGAHGRTEDFAPIRTFVPFIIDGEPNLLAGFVCTPLVRFPLSEISTAAKKHEKVHGTTVAELGNRNQPLDMIAYQKDGKDYLLLANSARGVMKVSTDNIARNAGITSPIPDGKTAGQDYETIDNLKGTVQLDRLDAQHAVVVMQNDGGQLTLKTVPLP
jgi:hypothetical protein